MKLRIRLERYSNNQNLAVVLDDWTTGERWCVLSVNVEGSGVRPNEFVMKTYSENEPVATAMLAARLFGKPLRLVQVGRAVCPVLRMPSPAPESFEFEWPGDAGVEL